MTGRVVIFAGNYKEAVDAACERGWGPHEGGWRYVDNWKKFHGWRNYELRIVGTFWDRDDAAQMFMRAVYAGATIRDFTGIRPKRFQPRPDEIGMHEWVFEDELSPETPPCDCGAAHDIAPVHYSWCGAFGR